MQSFKVRELRSTDTQSLLQFEIDNREWFESQIEARDPAFYSLEGITAHITDYLTGLSSGLWHPFVIEDGAKKIVGRANLKNIDLAQGCAEVGYRIDQHACGQGLATLALNHLIQAAQTRWQLAWLFAEVYADNLASRKVLGRCGFLAEDKPAQGGTSRFIHSLGRTLPGRSGHNH